MKVTEFIAGEMAQEKANTRKFLERIPADKWDWKPHPKSYSMGDLATHIANLPNWTSMTLNHDSLDLAPKDGEAPRTPRAKSPEEALSLMEKSYDEAIAAVKAFSDDKLESPWTMLMGGKEIFTMPKGVVLRNFVLNHLVHHRAQLSVYLRMNDIPLPAVYGPTADETGM